MTLNGTVDEIIFRNDENGYTVLVLEKGQADYVTVVGKFPQISAGEQLELVGSFSSHSKYGEQFNATKIKVVQPTSKEGIIKYLSSGLIKGIGPVTAASIVDKFGESTLDIIEFNPQRLLEVRGISQKRADEITVAFSEIKRMQNAVLFLQQYGISTNMSVKIFNTYGANTEVVLKQNPYKLIEDVEGIGFFTADKIAQNMGVPVISNFRFRAGILHVLKEASDKNGNTYLPLEELKTEISKLLSLVAEDYVEIFNEVVADLVVEKVVVETEEQGVPILALGRFHAIEKVVAEMINAFNFYHKQQNLDITSQIDFFERKNNIVLHDNQKEAIYVALNNGISVITGGPGTGKTTIIKCVLEAFKSFGKRVKLLAPTGRASKRLSESTNEEASTIHRALEIDFSNQNMFYYNHHNKLPYDVIIVDEVSMVDIQLFYYLLRAIKHGAQIVLVGDKDQLPSVGAGNVLSDILQSQVVSVVYLTQIYRQSEDSLIITNAHLINEGKFPLINNQSKDFFFSEHSDASSVLKVLVEMQSKRIPAFLGVDVSKIQVLAPMKAGLCGVDNLNKELQDKNNPPSLKKAEIVTDKTIYRIGDRVMQIQNNYERTWKRGYENGSGVFNGDIGNIIEVNTHGLELTVEFEDGRISIYNKSDISELVLSYAVTIHKSQGSEFDVVIMPVLGGPPMLLTKNLLYTAVTRAKKMVVLLGKKSSIAQMVKNNYTSVRYTLLKTMLVESYEDYKKTMQ